MKITNNAQRYFLLIVIGIIILIFLFPPYYLTASGNIIPLGYHFIFHYSTNTAGVHSVGSINYYLWWSQYAILGIISFIFYSLLKDTK